MKSNVVYEASLCTFVLRVETLIFHSMRFDISLQNFKKPLVDISPRIQKKKLYEEYLVIILAAEKTL